MLLRGVREIVDFPAVVLEVAKFPGGLVTSTFLNFLALPTLAWWHASVGEAADAAERVA